MIRRPNLSRFEWTNIWLESYLQALSCCRDHFSMQDHCEKSIFQNTTVYFIRHRWYTQRIGWMVQDVLKSMVIDCRILFEQNRSVFELERLRPFLFATTVHDPASVRTRLPTFHSWHNWRARGRSTLCLIPLEVPHFFLWSFTREAMNRTKSPTYNMHMSCFSALGLVPTGVDSIVF